MTKHVVLNNQYSMPVVGLGTWQALPGEVHDALISAIEIGYRHIDCAAIYGNEKEIGQALKYVLDKGVVTRDALFITSKLWNNAHFPNDVANAFEKTLADLQLDYLDLYLMHWPIAFKKAVEKPKKNSDYVSLTELSIIDTWCAMEQLIKAGKAKNIGVSNFSEKKLKALLAEAAMKPAVNQFECHPYLQQEALHNFCKAQNVVVTAYAPLGSGGRFLSLKKETDPDLFDDMTLQAIADKHNITVAEVMLAWSIAKGNVVIPKSVNKERLKMNLNAANIQLNKKDLTTISTLDKHYRYFDNAFAHLDEVYGHGYLWDE